MCDPSDDRGVHDGDSQKYHDDDADHGGGGQRDAYPRDGPHGAQVARSEPGARGDACRLFL